MALCIRCLAETPVCCIHCGPFVCNYTFYLNSKTLQICLVMLLQSKTRVFGSCPFPWQHLLWVLCSALPPALRMLWSRPPSCTASPASPSQPRVGKQPRGEPSSCPGEPGQGSSPRPSILSPPSTGRRPLCTGEQGLVCAVRGPRTPPPRLCARVPAPHRSCVVRPALELRFRGSRAEG